MDSKCTPTDEHWYSAIVAISRVNTTSTKYKYYVKIIRCSCLLCVAGDGTGKPGSAGAGVREGAARVLQLCMKSEWSPFDQVLKALEKAVAAAVEDGTTQPLDALVDPVSGLIQFTKFHLSSNYIVQVWIPSISVMKLPNVPPVSSQDLKILLVSILVL